MRNLWISSSRFDHKGLISLAYFYQIRETLTRIKHRGSEEGTYEIILQH
jgi:hypothetical protein